jgi:hypothetical protein
MAEDKVQGWLTKPNSDDKGSLRHHQLHSCTHVLLAVTVVRARLLGRFAWPASPAAYLWSQVLELQHRPVGEAID